jgi:hypothetical protein
VILGQGVEHEFDPGGNPQFLENLEQIILDGMLAKLQLLGNLAETAIPAPIPWRFGILF